MELVVLVLLAVALVLAALVWARRAGLELLAAAVIALSFGVLLWLLRGRL